MKVSLITISYNAEETIEDTIQSVLNQSYKNIEYIIIDGKSNDNTLDIIDRYKDRISKVVSEKDKGLYDAMNKGITHCTGDIIGMLNSDDLLASNDIIENLVKVFTSEKTDAVYGDLVYVDREDTKKVKRKWISKKYKKGAFKRGWMPPHPTFYVRKVLYQYYGKFDLRFKTSADYELMLRMIHKHNIKLSYLSEIMVKMRVGGQSNVSIKNRLNANREDKMAWDVNGLKRPLFLSLVKPLSKVGQFLKR
jgi:glycosyltransferase